MKNRSLIVNALVFVAALLVCFSYAWADSLVYDNSANDLHRTYSPGNSIEFGDEIILEGGSSFTITEFKFETFFLTGPNVNNSANANANGKESVNLRLLLNDGIVLSSGRPTPHTQLYESGFIDLLPGLESHDFSALAIPLPPGVDHITWTAEFVGIDSDEQAGLTVHHPPVVGGGYADFWQRDGSTWETFTFTDGTPASFDAQVFARVSDGGSTAVLLLLALAPLEYMRRRNRLRFQGSLRNSMARS